MKKMDFYYFNIFKLRAVFIQFNNLNTLTIIDMSYIPLLIHIASFLLNMDKYSRLHGQFPHSHVQHN